MIQGNVYFDVQGLSNIRRDVQNQDQDAIKQAAKQFEALFMQMGLKSMREASQVFESGLWSSNDTQTYQEWYDQQIALNLSEGEGVGLARSLMEQWAPASSKNKVLPTGWSIDVDQAEHSSSVFKEQAGSLEEEHAPFSGPLDFLQRLLPHAQQAAQKIGVDPKLLLAQAALETGWGKSLHREGGAQHFNLFGIKASKAWQGDRSSLMTHEFRDGQAQAERADFRDYSSYLNSFLDYADLITGHQRYEKAVAVASEPASYVEAIAEAGYATDPRYAEKIMKIYKSPLLQSLKMV